MRPTYYERKKEGLCPVCGGVRINPDFVLCSDCRVPVKPPQTSKSLSSQKIPGDKLFLGLHEWMIRQGKHYTPEYHI